MVSACTPHRTHPHTANSRGQGGNHPLPRARPVAPPSGAAPGCEPERLSCAAGQRETVVTGSRKTDPAAPVTGEAGGCGIPRPLPQPQWCCLRGMSLSLTPCLWPRSCEGAVCCPRWVCGRVLLGGSSCILGAGRNLPPVLGEDLTLGAAAAPCDQEGATRSIADWPGPAQLGVLMRSHRWEAAAGAESRCSSRVAAP